MKPKYIEEFEKLGFGIFVHFGLYSIIGKGEWHKYFYNQNDEEYHKLPEHFKVTKNWATNLVRTAKNAGAKYITITTRHHDGFSLYDTHGLSNFDVMHSATKRDLIKEFVDACNKENIVPMFYHTLLDWENKDYEGDFPKYIDYLVKSIEILCKNYGKIGGFWFDGAWNKPNADWQFDRLYKTIRNLQPKAMIINNTGIYDTGRVGHYEIDSVTYERGKPSKLVCDDGKERAGEVCDSLTDHWGYAKDDINFKSISYLIEELVECRYNSCNLLLNVGPLPNGELRPIEKYSLLELGKWVKTYKHIIFDCTPCQGLAENALVFKDDEWYYGVINNVPMSANENLTRRENRPKVVINTDKKVVQAKYLDKNDQKIVVDQKTHSFDQLPFMYGKSFCTRVMRFKLK